MHPQSASKYYTASFSPLKTLMLLSSDNVPLNTQLVILIQTVLLHTRTHTHARTHARTHTHTHTHPFNGPLSGTTRVSQYQKGKINLGFTEARDSEWQWNQLENMQVCTSLQTDNNTSTPPLSFLQAGCPSCRPTNSVKALKANKQCC